MTLVTLLILLLLACVPDGAETTNEGDSVLSIDAADDDDCEAYSEETGCTFDVAAPFLLMGATLYDWCIFCGDRFEYCILAYRGDCEGPFDNTPCGAIGNCLLKCAAEFCREGEEE